MASCSSVIVNHRVALPGTRTRGTIATHRLDYVRTRLGAVREPTDDDIRRQEMAEREDALGYISHRQGAVFDESSNCTLFDASGVADYRQVKAELMAADGAILTSIVTVRREDAEELGLQTKQDFERFLRANWQEHLEQMGIMEPQDVRWVAAFHTNSDKNFHVHVISWDDSGRFDSLIPKAELEEARQELVAKAMAPVRQSISAVRTQARDDLAADIRDGELSEAQLQKMQQIVNGLPEWGSLKYGNLAKKAPELKAKVDDLVEQRIRESPKLAEKVKSYKDAVNRHADLKGLKSPERQAYETVAMDDLKTRLGNAQLRRIKQGAGIANEPRQRKMNAVKLPEGNRVVMPKDRKCEQVIAQEINSCLTSKEKAELANALKEGRKPSEQLTDKVVELPSSKQYAKQAQAQSTTLKERVALRIASVGSAIENALNKATGSSKEDAGDNAGRQAIRLGNRAIRTVASQIVKAIKAPKLPTTPPVIQELKQSFKLKP